MIRGGSLPPACAYRSLADRPCFMGGWWAWKAASSTRVSSGVLKSAVALRQAVRTAASSSWMPEPCRAEMVTR